MHYGTRVSSASSARARSSTPVPARPHRTEPILIAARAHQHQHHTPSRLPRQHSRRDRPLAEQRAHLPPRPRCRSALRSVFPFSPRPAARALTAGGILLLFRAAAPRPGRTRRVPRWAYLGPQDDRCHRRRVDGRIPEIKADLPHRRIWARRLLRHVRRR